MKLLGGIRSKLSDSLWAKLAARGSRITVSLFPVESPGVVIALIPDESCDLVTRRLLSVRPVGGYNRANSFKIPCQR